AAGLPVRQCACAIQNPIEGDRSGVSPKLSARRIGEHHSSRVVAGVGIVWERACVAPSPGDHPFTPDLFARADESDDALFYAAPRKVVHLDEPAIAAVSEFFAENLPAQGELLDLMASWRSHLPNRPRAKRVVGLGMNAEEMSDNPELDEFVVHDLNRD